MKYQAYSEYKDSGVEWLGEIPEYWKIASLSRLFCIKAGGDVKTEFFSEVQTENHPYPIYTNANDEKAVYGYTSKCNYSPNTITVSGRGEVGFAVYRDHAYDAIIRLLVLSAIGTSSCKFFTYFINEVIDFRVESSAIGQLSTQQISPYKVVFPSFDEQTRIANFLDHETAKIDTLIEKQQQLIKLLKEKRQAVISHAVTKGLNPNIPMCDSGVEWLGEVPEHWDVLCIKHIVSIPVTDGPHETPAFIDDGIPFVSAEAVSSGKIDFEKIRAHISKEDNERYSKKYSPKMHDVYMVKSGATTGVTAIVETDMEFNIWSPLAVIRCKNNSDPYFVLNFLRSFNFQEAVQLNWSFGTQQNIGMGVIENLHVTRPPIVEAKQIAKYLAEKCSIYDGIIDKANKQIELSKERRTALISAAVTGKIDVRNFK